MEVQCYKVYVIIIHERGPWGFSDVYKPFSTSIYWVLQSLPPIAILAMNTDKNICMQLSGTEVLLCLRISPLTCCRRKGTRYYNA